MKDRPLLEAALENTEVVVDQFLSNDLVKDIPSIGTALKICKTFGDVGDKLFLARILRFLTELDSVQPDIKKKLIEKMRNNPDEAKKVGEAVLFSIDKVSDLEKPEVIAKISLAYINEQITCNALRRMTEAVNQAFVDDLKALINKDITPNKSQEPYLRYLVTTGLTEVVAGKTVDEGGNLYFEITEFGYEFLRAYRYASRYVS
jgi:hypothetical protein